MTAQEFQEKEIKVNCLAGFAGGSIGALLTNALESITVAKQTDPSTEIVKLIRQEGRGLLTKGLLPRVYYASAQSLVFFSLVL